jgi:glutamate transport system substrate-binding protein
VSVGMKLDQPQISYQSGSQTDGFEKRLVDYITEQKNETRWTYSPVVTKDRDTRLANRDLPLIVATYSDTPGRRGAVELVGPYMQTPQGVLVRKNDRRVRSADDLDHKSVCTTDESTSLAELKRNKGINMTVATKTSFGDCVKLLQNEQVDAVSTDLLILYGYQETSPGLSIAKDKAGHPVEIPAEGVNRWMVGLQPGDSADCPKVLGALRSFLSDQSWEQNFNTWFGDVKKDYADWSTRFKPDLSSLACVGRTR